MPVVKECPKFDSDSFTDVPYLDMGAVLCPDGTLSVFAVNRSMEESLPLEISLRGFEKARVLEHIVLESENALDTNSEEEPEKVKPHFGGNALLENNILKASLNKLSWNVIRIAPQ